MGTEDAAWRGKHKGLKRFLWLCKVKSSVFLQAASGIIGLSDFLTKAKVLGFENPRCGCRQEMETSKHSVLHCPKWERGRRCGGRQGGFSTGAPRWKHRRRRECWQSGCSELASWSDFTLQHASLKNGTRSLGIFCQPDSLVHRAGLHGGRACIHRYTLRFM